jgi:hypothetical protein
MLAAPNAVLLPQLNKSGPSDPIGCPDRAHWLVSRGHDQEPGQPVEPLLDSTLCSRKIPYLDLDVAERKWPGEPCRPAGEKTPPTAPPANKDSISTPELGGVFCLPAS